MNILPLDAVFIPMNPKPTFRLCLRLLPVFLFPLLSGAAQASIEQVRLYPGEGEIIRHVRIDGTGPSGSVTIDGLPGELNPDGLRARIVEGTGFRLGSLRFERLERHEIPESPERLEAEAGLRRIVHELEDLTVDLEGAREKAKLHEELREALLEGFEESPSPDSLAALVLKSHEETRAARMELRKLERQLEADIKELESARTAAQKRVQELLQAERSRNGRVVMDLVGSPDGAAVIELRTPLRGVGWRPVYRVNARPAEGLWELDYQAKLHNRTGELWDAVPVVLLTGRPGWRLEAPDLPPVYLQKPRPVALEQRREKAMPMLEAMAADANARPAPPEAVASERLTTQFELTLPAPVSLPAFEDGKVVDLVRESMEATYWSAITPLLDEAAYLHGEAEMTLDWPLLAGPATLLVDGAISGQRQLPFTSPGEPLELGFGENAALAVEHKALDRMDRDAGFFDKVRKYKRHYEATVMNRMPVAHTVRVSGRFPVSRDEAIEVERIEPDGLEVDPETGVFEWERELAPGAEATFTTRFEVTAPRDWNLPEVF